MTSGQINTIEAKASGVLGNRCCQSLCLTASHRIQYAYMPESPTPQEPRAQSYTERNVSYTGLKRAGVGLTAVGMLLVGAGCDDVSPTPPDALRNTLAGENHIARGLNPVAAAIAAIKNSPRTSVEYSTAGHRNDVSKTPIVLKAVTTVASDGTRCTAFVAGDEKPGTLEPGSGWRQGNIPTPELSALGVTVNEGLQERSITVNATGARIVVKGYESDWNSITNETTYSTHTYNVDPDKNKGEETLTARVIAETAQAISSELQACGLVGSTSPSAPPVIEKGA